MTQTTLDQCGFYIRLMKDTGYGALKLVSDACNINLDLKSGGDLTLIPVFEAAELNLLMCANAANRTDIKWALSQNFEYLPAYFKRYVESGVVRNEVVVTTSNYCEARFFAAKELMHCLVEDDGYVTTNSPTKVNELITSLATNIGNFQNSSSDSIIDQVAWIGAAEYLVPEAWLPLLVAQHKAISKAYPRSNAYLFLSQILRVPQTVLRWRMQAVMELKEAYGS